MSTSYSPDERLEIAYIHSAPGNLKATIPPGFSVANSRMTEGKHAWRPAMYAHRGNMQRRPSAKDWADRLCSVRDSVKDQRVYVVMKDGSGHEGWIPWADVPSQFRRSAAATKQRMVRTWCAINGLLSGPSDPSDDAGPAPAPSDTTTDPAAGLTAPVDQGGINLRSRHVGQVTPPRNTQAILLPESSYDGGCNEPLFPGAKHEGKSTHCAGGFVFQNAGDYFQHCHSTNDSTSSPCQQQNCSSGYLSNYRVCEGCASNVWSKGYTGEERAHISKSLELKRPVDCTPVCDEHAAKIRDNVKYECNGFHACTCTYWSGKAGIVKPAVMRIREIREPVSKLHNGLHPVLCDYPIWTYCARENCEQVVLFLEKMFRCGQCFGFIDQAPELADSLSQDEYDDIPVGMDDDFYPAVLPQFPAATAGAPEEEFNYDNLFGPGATNVFNNAGEVNLNTGISQNEFFNINAPPTSPAAGLGDDGMDFDAGGETEDGPAPGPFRY